MKTLELSAREKAISFLETTRHAANDIADALDPERTLRESDPVVMSLDRIAIACSHALAVERARERGNVAQSLKRNTMREPDLLAPRCRNRKGQLSGARYVGRVDTPSGMWTRCALCKQTREDHEFDEQVSS